MYKSRYIIIATLCLFSLNANAEWPDEVTLFEVEKGKTVKISGDFETGKVIEDLSWAEDSMVACFPGFQNPKYQGNHVFFATRIPKRSLMEITVTPDDPKQNISLYALEMGTTNFYLPPFVPGVVSCEASHKWDRPHVNKTQDHTRTVKQNALLNPYNILIGVTGPSTTVKGGFTVEITTEKWK